jgi:hypothetical protein
MASKSFLVDIQLNKNQLLNPVIHSATADLGSPVAGQIYYNSVASNLRLRTATAWEPIASKSYVDAVVQGLDVKDSVKAATTTNVTLDGGAPNVVDGVTLSLGSRVLVKSQTDASENGIYVVQVLGTGADGVWVRSIDADTSEKVTSGMFTFVEGGETYDNAGFVLATDGEIVLDTTNLSFSQFSGAGQITAGDGLVKTGNTFDVVGTADRIIANAESIDIASTYVGQTSITTVGTITTGTWEGSTVAIAHGGTNATSFTTDQLVYFNGTSLASTSLDVNLITRKYSATIGNGSSTEITVTHSLNTKDVVVSIRDAATDEEVTADISRPTVDTILVTFNVAPASNAYRVVVVG